MFYEALLYLLRTEVNFHIPEEGEENIHAVQITCHRITSSFLSAIMEASVRYRGGVRPLSWRRLSAIMEASVRYRGGVRPLSWRRPSATMEASVRYHGGVRPLSWRRPSAIMEASVRYHGGVCPLSWRRPSAIMEASVRYHGNVCPLSWKRLSAIMESPRLLLLFHFVLLLKDRVDVMRQVVGGGWSLECNRGMTREERDWAPIGRMFLFLNNVFVFN